MSDELQPPPASADIPRATYRLQLHAGFDLRAAQRRIGHLHRLGISHLYASPVLAARRGSLHGYDGVDPGRLNPELGDDDAFAELSGALRAAGIGLLLDIVPNHLAVLAANNEWWLDVLANGPAAEHAAFFDIEWTPPQHELRGKVLLPVLGQPYGHALEAGEIVPAFDAARGAMVLRYFEHVFPIDMADHAALLNAVPLPDDATEADRARVASIAQGCAALPARDTADAVQRATRQREVVAFAAALGELHARGGWAARWLDGCAEALRGRSDEPASWDRLDALLQRQAYRLAHWRAAGDELNYRRFFDVDALAGLRIEQPEVFEAVHRRILDWAADGRVQALRIDHPDGMADPQAYFQRLQQRVAQARGDANRAVWIVAEKILGDEEPWPEHWAVHGDTGYRFANQAIGLFVDGSHEAEFDALYAGFVGRAIDYGAELDAAKRTIMAIPLAADLRLLTELAHDLALGHRHSRDFTRPALRAAIVEFTAALDVYRTYVTERGVTPADRARIERCAAAARSGCRPSQQVLVDFIRGLLLEPLEGAARRACQLRFVRRLQQFTAPVMAKAMEDTAFYRYHRLVALNDVGGEPRRFGHDADEFHAANRVRLQRTPHTMLSSSTHDSKRSEDVRARLAVLSEMPAAWGDALRHWHELACTQWRIASVDPTPERNDEMLLFQTLVGIWPAGADGDAAGFDTLRERVVAYMLKAVREAKQHSSWLDADTVYEQGLQRAVEVLLARLEPNPLLTDLRGFVERLAPFGCVNSLALVALKLTSPGVPDLYQGQEDWQHALVDPDNRRPVDWDRLAARLEQADALDATALASQPLAGGLHKLFVTARLLRWRRTMAALLRDGDYLPLAVQGPRATHIVAFLRRHADDACLTIVPRLVWQACQGAIDALNDGSCWAGTRVLLPADAPRRWHHLLTDRELGADGGIAVNAVLQEPCVAVLQACR
ncbi:MAG: malto-oligosyltrehalose synthase [Burkholderiaceae bacterium]|nr:malto-oligosyltrehalose synthase [Burkholderiaceae bacterium]